MTPRDVPDDVLFSTIGTDREFFQLVFSMGMPEVLVRRVCKGQSLLGSLPDDELWVIALVYADNGTPVEIHVNTVKRAYGHDVLIVATPRSGYEVVRPFGEFSKEISIRICGWRLHRKDIDSYRVSDDCRQLIRARFPS